MKFLTTGEVCSWGCGWDCCCRCGGVQPRVAVNRIPCSPPIRVCQVQRDPRGTLFSHSSYPRGAFGVFTGCARASRYVLTHTLEPASYRHREHQVLDRPRHKPTVPASRRCWNLRPWFESLPPNFLSLAPFLGLSIFSTPVERM